MENGKIVLYHKLGGIKQKIQIERWTKGEEPDCNFTVSTTEVTSQLLWKRRNAQADCNILTMHILV